MEHNFGGSDRLIVIGVDIYVQKYDYDNHIHLLYLSYMHVLLA